MQKNNHFDNSAKIPKWLLTTDEYTPPKDLAYIAQTIPFYRLIDILPMPKCRGFLDTNDTCLLK